MLTAEEARNKSSQVKKTKLEDKLQDIEFEIEQAIEKGRNSVLIEGFGHETREEKELNDKIMATLARRGYTVKYTTWAIVARMLITIRIEW